MRSYAKLFICFFNINLSGVVTCWACMAPLLTSPAPLLHPSCTSPLLSAPLLRFSDLSCTFPDPCCTSLPCTSPAEVRRLSERHFKPFQNKCEAMQSFYMCFFNIKLSGVVTCWACMAPLLTSPAPLLHPSCTSPDPCCTSLCCTCPAEVRRLSERHFKPCQSKCEATQKAFI